MTGCVRCQNDGSCCNSQDKGAADLSRQIQLVEEHPAISRHDWAAINGMPKMMQVQGLP